MWKITHLAWIEIVKETFTLVIAVYSRTAQQIYCRHAAVCRPYKKTKQNKKQIIFSESIKRISVDSLRKGPCPPYLHTNFFFKVYIFMFYDFVFILANIGLCGKNQMTPLLILHSRSTQKLIYTHRDVLYKSYSKNCEIPFFCFLPFDFR